MPVEKGYAYALPGGVYYRVEKFDGYGKLSGRTLEDMQAGARVDIDEEKVTQYGTDSWVRLVFDEFKKGWHAIANRLFGWWNMQGAANIDLVITPSGQFCRFENSGLNAGAEEGQIPGTDRFTHSLDARMSCRSGNKILDEFVGLEIALGG